MTLDISAAVTAFCRHMTTAPQEESISKLGRFSCLLPISLLAGLPAILMMQARAEVKMPAIFSDHAVLQRAEKVPIWGNADPGEEVTVTLGSAEAHTKAGVEGHWRTNLNLSQQEAGPFVLAVNGKNQITISDVLIGEVWLCSGQSNMEFTVAGALGAKEEHAAPPNPMLREFLVMKAASLTPLDQIQGKWIISSPQTVDMFTAVGYFFGKKLQSTLQAPVGLIDSTWGGTPSEAWTPEAGLNQIPELKSAKDAQFAYQRAFPTLQADYQTHLQGWLQSNTREDHDGTDPQTFAAPDASTAGWTTITLPGSLAQNGIPGAGAIWLRKFVHVPTVPSMELRAGYQLALGTIHGFETVYWNGQKIAGKTIQSSGITEWRRYQVPLAQLTPGQDAVLAIRIYNSVGDAAIDLAHGGFDADGLKLSGPWQAKAEYSLPNLPNSVIHDYPKEPTQPDEPRFTASELFNGMINPLIPYAVKGVLWYQGEANVARAVQYRTAFPLLIKSWRDTWGQGDLPFYFCQLANFYAKVTKPENSEWAELRDAQTSTLSLPNTGMAVLIDLGEEGNLHPRNKRDVGERLAMIALSHDYGRQLSSSGPLYQSMQVEKSSIRIRFDHADGGLVAQPLPATYLSTTRDPVPPKPLILTSPGSALQGFEIAGGDAQWHWADARIDGNSVIVSSSAVPHPVSVRYAWANDPICNLYNASGLPASPFRTDNFPLTTEKRQFTSKASLP